MGFDHLHLMFDRLAKGMSCYYFTTVRVKLKPPAAPQSFYMECKTAVGPSYKGGSEGGRELCKEKTRS
jgi:hypothetical protein